MIPEKIRAWLAAQCSDDEIHEKAGVKYLPNHICEQKLDFMQTMYDVIWSTRNYKSNLYLFQNEIWCSASLELVLEGVDDEGNQWRKVLVGCATFKASSIAPNTHLDATAKSFCTVNAAMDLGDQFGRFLSVQVTPDKMERVKIKPSIIEIKKMEQAISENDIDTIMSLSDNYDFHLETDSTGKTKVLTT